MDGRPKRIKKFGFTSVCVYNRLRVDGALVSNLEATASKAVLGGLKFKLQNRVKDQTTFAVTCLVLYQPFLFSGHNFLLKNLLCFNDFPISKVTCGTYKTTVTDQRCLLSDQHNASRTKKAS